jgi:hypothetical protein
MSTQFNLSGWNRRSFKESSLAIKFILLQVSRHQVKNVHPWFLDYKSYLIGSCFVHVCLTTYVVVLKCSLTTLTYQLSLCKIDKLISVSLVYVIITLFSGLSFAFYSTYQISCKTSMKIMSYFAQVIL